MTKGERKELELLSIGPQPAYIGHQNRARAGVQNRLVLDRRWARYLPIGILTEMLAGNFPRHETVEITDAGRVALAQAKALDNPKTRAWNRANNKHLRRLGLREAFVELPGGK